MKKFDKNIDPAGEVREEELVNVTENDDATGGATPAVTVPISIAASAAFCPSTKCSSKC